MTATEVQNSLKYASLKMLEGEYFDTPAQFQRGTLRQINETRAELGLPAVDARLKLPPAPKVAKPKPVLDHTEAREVYARYMARKKELLPHQEYTTEIERATAGGGQTPAVRRHGDDHGEGHYTTGNSHRVQARPPTGCHVRRLPARL